MRLGESIFLKAKKSNNFLVNVQKKKDIFFKKFMRVCKTIDEIDMPSLSSHKLAEYFKRFYSHYVTAYSIPSAANAIDFYTQKKIVSSLEPFSESYTNYLTIINSPVSESYVSAEKNDLLRISQLINKNKKLSAIFRNEGIKDIDKSLPDLKTVKRLVEQHTKKYFWMQNNYAKAVILDEKYFINEIKKIFISGDNPQEQLKINKKNLKNIITEKRNLMKKLRLGEAARLAIRLQEISINWRDQRKRINQIADHYHFMFLREAASRYHFSVEKLEYTLPSEFVHVLEGENLNESEMVKRRESFFAVSNMSGDHLCTGKDAAEFNKKLYKEKIAQNFKELKGVTASLGQGIGRAKIIISNTQFDKMERGDILVTSMTRPEFVPVMKLAKAIVTDEGGVTCHAAIVSRELGIPCVIGTKIATKVLKDGDLVEVDANNGVVKKI